MNVLVVPHGKAGWDGRMRVLEAIVRENAAPPRRYDHVLVLVASSRLRRIYGKAFLDLAERLTGGRAVVPPSIATLHQFFQRCHERLGAGQLIDENARLILFEGVVKELISGTSSFGGSADLLAPSLAAAVADAVEELSAAGIAPDRFASAVAGSDAADKPQARLLAEAYARYEAELSARGLVDPAGMLAALADRFDPAWLDGYSTVIVDGVHDAPPLAAQALRQIVSRAGGFFLVDAPSADHVRSAGERHPLRLTRGLLDRLGLAAEAAPSPADASGRYLADALFSERSFAAAGTGAPVPFEKEIRLVSAVNARQEVSAIAGGIKQLLRSGAPPDSVLVAFPSLDEYGALVEEIFLDFGIPYNRALGRQLSSSPVATAVISLLGACREDVPGQALLRLFSSPFLKFAEDRALPPALDRFLRERRITGGRQRLLDELRRHAGGDDGRDVLSGPLTGLFAALEPFSGDGPAPLLAWMERLAALVAWAGIADRVAAIPGAFNINVQARRKLEETLASLRGAGRLFPEYRYTFNEWLILLKKAFLRARFQVPPDDEGGVQVLGLEESVNHAWAEIYLGGMVDGKFPQRQPQNIFLPESVLEPLGVRTLETARQNAAYHFYRLLLSAPRVTLSFPSAIGDKPVVPSPFLAELEPLRLAGLLSEEKDVQFSLQVNDSRSLPELAKAAGFRRELSGLDEVLAADQDGMAAIRAALEERPAAVAAAFGSRDQREFSVTELDDYLACPYDYYVKHRLKLLPLEEVSEDISAPERGSAVHAVLRRFYEEWRAPVRPDDRQLAHELLARLADAEFSRAADTFRNRREREFFLQIIAGRFLDAEEAFWTRGMRPAYLERKIESFPLTLAEDTAVEVRGKIDRIDVDRDGNFIVVDYKTGRYPRPKMGVEQEIFQLPVYAMMAKTALARGEPPLARPVGLAYYDLKGVSGGAARDVVLFDKDFRDDQPAAMVKASPKSAEEFKAILRQGIDRAKAAIEGIRAGRFPASPKERTSCRYCPNSILCGSAGKEEAGPDES